MDQFPPPPPVPPIPEPLLAPELREVPWRAREALIIVLFAVFTGGFFSILLTVLVRPHAGALTNDQRNMLTLAVTCLLEGALGFWVWLWVKLRHQRGLAALGLRFHRSDIGFGILAAFIGVIAASVITQIVVSITQKVTHHTYQQPKQLPADIHGFGQILLAWFAVVVVAPIAEELFFRGFLYQALRRWLGVGRGLVLSAAIFALSHGAPLLIVAIFPLGIILGFVFERRNSLYANISTHMAYNLFGFIVLISVRR